MLARQTLITITILVGLIVAGVTIGVITSEDYQATKTPEKIDGLLWPTPKQISEFTILDHKGKDFEVDNLKNKWSFLFFGFTHCPDVCPLTLAALNEFYTSQGRDDIQVLFITLDPERDTLERLTEYTGYFNPDFIGLGGSLEQIDSLASQIGIAYMYGPPSDDGNYMVDHTSAVFLLDPQARLVSIFSAPHSPSVIASRFAEIESFLRDQTEN